MGKALSNRYSMGSCFSRSNKVHIITGARMASFDPEFDQNSELQVVIPAKFAELDSDGSGEVDYEEFCAGFNFADTPLTKKLFDAFDYDLSGQISVVEFIAGLRNWKNFSQQDKMKFAYKIYDLDGSGYIDPPELAECLADTNSAWRDRESSALVIRKILKCLKDADITRIKLGDFITLANKFPSALFLPLFGLMEKIFITVEIHETEAANTMSKREKRISERNSRRGSRSQSWLY